MTTYSVSIDFTSLAKLIQTHSCIDLLRGSGCPLPFPVWSMDDTEEISAFALCVYYGIVEDGNDDRHVLMLTYVTEGGQFVVTHFAGAPSSGLEIARSCGFDAYWEVEDLLRAELPADTQPLRNFEGIQIQQYFSELGCL